MRALPLIWSAILFAFWLQLGALSAQSVACGDCNSDGVVDVLDALTASRHAVGSIVLVGASFRLCDVDADLQVAVLDALRIAQTSVGLTVELICRPLDLPPPIEETDGHFVTSLVCAICHSNAPTALAMRDELGADIAPFDLWQSTMMANAARDPFWRAQVSAEVVATPSRAAEIQAKCVSCHAPMASTEAALIMESRPGLEVLDLDTPRGQIARDGASCALCHQIRPSLLGTPASYSGGFVIEPLFEIYGPHDGVLTFAMESLSGFRPVLADHVDDAALCATCHTLFTDALDPQGVLTGDRMPEQTPYLEWRNSVFNDEVAMPAPQAATCQDCHLPTSSVGGVPLSTAIARTPLGADYGTPDRSPFGRHIFVGGNTLIPQILRDNPVRFGTLASTAAFDATIAMARDQLTSRTATIAIGAATRIVDTLNIPVSITNLTGHKFPTSYPSRRAWIRLRVINGVGTTVFASGEHDARGRILDSTGAIHAFEGAGGPIAMHHQTIVDPQDVQIYEAVMRDPAGAPTFLLMRAAGYFKDNRILPLGWNPLHSEIADIAPAGVALDPHYTAAAAAGADTVVYSVNAPLAGGPYTIEAALLYETISSRSANELFAYRTGAILSFRDDYEAADVTPVTIDDAVAMTP